VAVVVIVEVDVELDIVLREAVACSQLPLLDGAANAHTECHCEVHLSHPIVERREEILYTTLKLVLSLGVFRDLPGASVVIVEPVEDRLKVFEPELGQVLKVQ